MMSMGSGQARSIYAMEEKCEPKNQLDEEVLMAWLALALLVDAGLPVHAGRLMEKIQHH